MKWLPSTETRAAVLRHPFFLAGLAVVVLLGLTAATLVVADSVQSNKKVVATVVVAPAETTTAGPTSRTATASGVSGTTKGTTAVRAAPGGRTPVLGTLGAKNDVHIDGRTTDAKWMRIVFPPNSALHGWIDATLLDIIGDPATLVVATAEPQVVVDLPTAPPVVVRTAIVEKPPTAGVTPTAPPAGGDLPDLAIDGTTVSNGKLFMTVVNQGKGEMKGDLVVAVFNADGTKLLGGATLPRFTLAPGRSIDIGTGYVVAEDQSLFLVVDPNGTIAESNDNNNNRTVAIAVGDAPKTPTLGGDETPTPDVPATLVALATQTGLAAAATPTPNVPATLVALATQTAEAAR